MKTGQLNCEQLVETVYLSLIHSTAMLFRIDPPTRTSELSCTLYSLIASYNIAAYCISYRLLTNISPYTWAGMAVCLCISSSVFGAARLVTYFTYYLVQIGQCPQCNFVAAV